MAKKDIKTLLEEAGYTEIKDTGTSALRVDLTGVVKGFVATPKPYFRASERFSDEHIPTDIILKGLQEHKIINAEVDGALQLFYPPESVRLTGFNEKHVRRDQDGLVILEEGASQTDDVLQVIDVDGKLIAWRRDTGEVFWGTAQRPSTTPADASSAPADAPIAPVYVDSEDEGEASFTLVADDFVSKDEDPWLHQLLATEFATKQRARMRWALRAYIRYRRLSRDYVQSFDMTKDFEFEPSVKRAMSLVNELLVNAEEVAIRAARSEAESLREDVEQAYRAALEGEGLSHLEWQNLCVRREELVVQMHTLPNNEQTRAAYDIIQDLDDTAELLLIEAASHHTIDDELLLRALETGDATWWLREHAEAR